MNKQSSASACRNFATCLVQVEVSIEVGLDVAKDRDNLLGSVSFSHESLPGVNQL